MYSYFVRNTLKGFGRYISVSITIKLQTGRQGNKFSIPDVGRNIPLFVPVDPIHSLYVYECTYIHIYYMYMGVCPLMCPLLELVKEVTYFNETLRKFYVIRGHYSLMFLISEK